MNASDNTIQGKIAEANAKMVSGAIQVKAHGVRTCAAMCISVGVMLVGAMLRLNSRWMAWPREYSFSGPRASTQWGIMESAYNDIALVLMITGSVLLAVSWTYWLFGRDAEQSGRDARSDEHSSEYDEW